MNQRIREKLDSWDLKSFFLTILVLSIVGFLYFYFTDIRDQFRSGDQQSFNRQTTGQKLSVEKLDRISQGRYGTKIQVDSYKVKYQFQFQGQVFEGIDLIPVTVKNKKLLTEILQRGTSDHCTVKFDPADPNKSLIIESE